MSFNFPYMESTFIYIGLAIILFGIFFLFYFFIKAIIRNIKREKYHERKRTSAFTSLIKLLSVLLLIAIGFAVFLFGMFIQSVTTFTQKTLVAEVFCKQINKQERTMNLVVVKKQGREANTFKPYLVKGEQWFIQGDVIKWEDWANFLGLRTAYRLTRIGGSFTKPEDQSNLNPSNYSLIPLEETGYWEWLHKFGYKLPMINDVYGNASFKYASENKKYNVYVTTSGFSIETEQVNPEIE